MSQKSDFKRMTALAKKWEADTGDDCAAFVVTMFGDGSGWIKKRVGGKEDTESVFKTLAELREIIESLLKE
jgi:hypothetical protein